MRKQLFLIVVLAVALAAGIVVVTAGPVASSSGGLAPPTDAVPIRMPPDQNGVAPPDPAAPYAAAQETKDRAITAKWMKSKELVDAIQILKRDKGLNDLLANQEYEIAESHPWGTGNTTWGALLYLELKSPLSGAARLPNIADENAGSYRSMSDDVRFAAVTSLMVIVDDRSDRVVAIRPLDGQTAIPDANTAWSSSQRASEADLIVAGDKNLQAILSNVDYTVFDSNVWLDTGGATIGAIVRLELNKPLSRETDLPSFGHFASNGRSYQSKELRFRLSNVTFLTVYVDQRSDRVVCVRPSDNAGSITPLFNPLDENSAEGS